MFIKHHFKSSDPFAHLRYPSGATGLVVKLVGFEFGQDIYGHFYVLKRVIQSRDYYTNGEARCGTTYPFIDTYWRVGSKADARMLWMYLLTKREQYRNFSLIHK